MYTLPLHAATSVVANNALPNFDKVMSGALEQNPVISNNGLTMDITQTTHNAVIKWNSFYVGGSATVNFWGPDNHNTLNYVNSANMSQIYGTINANNNGNIFIVNPAGVQIGNSAQINVGSLYVSNKKFSDDELKKVKADTNVNDFMQGGTLTNAELMSLGNINITNIENGNVTFEGNGRIVIDTERIKKNDVVTDNFIVKTDDVNDVLLGYDAYNTGAIKNTYAGKGKTFNDNVLVNGQKPTEDVKGYMWVEDVNQLQAINTNLSGNYALRNSIDATATSSWNDEGTDTDITDTDINEGFKSIGIDEDGNIIEANVNTDNGVVTKNGFYGKFDGLDYNIFGLTINRSGENNVGLFGVVDGANINNVTLVGGSITGGQSVGAIVGSARDSVISNSTNSTAVNGDYNIGGIVGDAQNSTLTNLINTGTIGAATGDGNRIGGLVGNLQESSLGGNSYNLGAVTSVGHDVGGLVGDNTGTITNAYNTSNVVATKQDGIVGGLVGDNTGTITNAYNTSNVVATKQDGIVGGLVGDNTGTITNAYNTSNVVTTKQDGIVGNLVGINGGTVQYVYGVADKLIGNGNAAEYGYVIDGSDTWLQEGTYEDFTFGANGWKIYDGSTLPMLSVFLTKVTVVDQHLVNQYFSAKHYGELHQITADDIKALIAIGAISAPDGFGAFNNNNGLIQGVADDAMANSGNWLYSQQILGSNINGLFNPNNLGYDISLVYSPFENEDWPNNHWNYLFNDAPFDRNKDFRERKAEVNFVDGGMEI